MQEEENTKTQDMSRPTLPEHIASRGSTPTRTHVARTEAVISQISLVAGSGAADPSSSGSTISHNSS